MHPSHLSLFQTKCLWRWLGKSKLINTTRSVKGYHEQFADFGKLINIFPILFYASPHSWLNMIPHTPGCKCHELEGWFKWLNRQAGNRNIQASLVKPEKDLRLNLLLALPISTSTQEKDGLQPIKKIDHGEMEEWRKDLLLLLWWQVCTGAHVQIYEKKGVASWTLHAH